MSIRYFRRFRMEVLIHRIELPLPILPANYLWHAWHPSLLSRHAAVKYLSFRSEIDAILFATFNDFNLCQNLMSEIARQSLFLRGTTWLVSHTDPETDRSTDCGTIQGLARNRNSGAIQNVGVVPEHRGFGLGRAIVLQSLHGFQQAGKKRVSLEVTADNDPAIQLYESLGFRITRTLYKAVETPELATPTEV